MSDAPVRYELGGDGIATITWDAPGRPVNVLNAASIAAFGEAVRRGEDAYALLDPGTVAKIYASLTQRITDAQQSGLQPIVLTSPGTRLALKRLTERAAPSLVVLSYSEIAPGLRVESIGQVSTTEEALEPVGAAV